MILVAITDRLALAAVLGATMVADEVLSGTRVAGMLESAGVAIFAQAPVGRGGAWDLQMLERWVLAARQRIDSLNRVAKDFEMTLQLDYGRGFHTRDTVHALMSVEEWQTLSSDGNFIRGERTRALDKLVQKYHSGSNEPEHRIGLLIQIFELCVEYRQESRGSRTNAAMLLAKQVMQTLQTGLKVESMKGNTRELKQWGMT